MTDKSKTRSGRPVPPAPADAVDDAIAWLRERKAEIRVHLTRQAQEIGEYLIDRFFGGDAALVASQNPTKNVSFRALCERADLPFPPTALRRFLHVAVNFRFLPADRAMALAPSHHSVLYQVADPRERRRVGVEAAERGVSVRQLRRMVKGKGRRRPGAGRKTVSAFEKNWKQLAAVLDALSAECDREAFLDESRRAEVQAECRDLRDRLTRILDRVADVSPPKPSDG